MFLLPVESVVCQSNVCPHPNPLPREKEPGLFLWERGRRDLCQANVLPHPNPLPRRGNGISYGSLSCVGGVGWSDLVVASFTSPQPSQGEGNRTLRPRSPWKKEPDAAPSLLWERRGEERSLTGTLSRTNHTSTASTRQLER